MKPSFWELYYPTLDLEKTKGIISTAVNYWNTYGIDEEISTSNKSPGVKVRYFPPRKQRCSLESLIRK